MGRHANPLKTLEAGTGIEPVFTDLQSRQFASYIKSLPQFSYQDKASTEREPDTSPGDPEKENPGALAGATGAIEKQSLTAEDYRMRARCATALAEAIAECHPDDAVQLMVAALYDLTPGGPRCDVFLSAAEDAAWWASIAGEDQLSAVLAATLDQLGSRAMHLDMRKRLFMALWRSFRPVDRQSFLALVGRQA